MTSTSQSIAGVIVSGALTMVLVGCGSFENEKSSETTAVAALAPPPVDPVVYRKLAPRDAIAYNSSLPTTMDPGPGAKPFFVAPGLTFDRAADCLTAAIYYEAATESAQGQRGVAQVVLNRVRHPAYPKSVCDVVYQGAERTTGCQFSFACDGSLLRSPMQSFWRRARAVAVAALSGSVEPSVGLATHYHANYVVPYWSSSLARSATIGAHIFYRWNGRWGTPAAFTGRYSQLEPDPAVLLQKIRFAAAAARGTQTLQLPYADEAHSDALAVVAAPQPDRPAPLVLLKADEGVGILRDDLKGSRPLLADLAARKLIESPAHSFPKLSLATRTD